MSGATEKPAFPSVPHGLFKGLSFREYAAVAAMQGLLSNPDTTDMSHDECAKCSVNAADALIAELSKPQT